MRIFLIVLLAVTLTLSQNLFAISPKKAISYEKEVIDCLKKEIIARADKAMNQPPQTITMYVCDRSAGGKHDFFSEADYFWPDPDHPGGPYIERDGMSNPNNFVAHRKAMIRFSQIIGALASAYKVTGDEEYVKQAMIHLKAWFADTATRMNPSLLYSQAVKGKHTGRNYGIIDTIHLMEVAQGVIVMESAKVFDKDLLAAIKSWFAEYLVWLTTHPYGIQEMNVKNNHSTCWAMQVASFAKLTQNTQLLDFCRTRYKEIVLPNQMDERGAFPLEINRTKPYGYSLFNLDAMTMLCQILSDKDHDLWNYTTPDGKCIRKGIEFLFPYVDDKTKWPFRKDVMYWDNWPVAQTFLVFGAEEFNNESWLKVWEKNEHFPTNEEVIRNFPIRNPVIWME